MKLDKITKILLSAVIILLGVNRYYIKCSTSSSDFPSFCYKIDRLTGRIWAMVGYNIREITEINSGGRFISEKEKAINLAKRYEFEDYYSFPAEYAVKQWVEEKKGDITIEGWGAEKVRKNVYLVSYTYTKKSETGGWYFEVDVKNEIVRFVNDDEELSKKYNLRD